MTHTHPSSGSSSFSRLEKFVFIHTSVLVIASGWVFGGNIWWMRLALQIWASLSVVLTICAFRQTGSWGDTARRKAWWLAPLVLFAALVVASAFNPSFQTIISEGESLRVHKGAAHPEWPSTVNPARSLVALWLGAGVYLSAFNLVLTIRSRTMLRRLLILIAINTLALSVIGTVQKLSGAGYYFGAATSPNIRFFGTFIYNNHWGAFMILGLATATGLLFHHIRKHETRDLWHSPFSAALMGVVFIAATAPISASRAATAMTGVIVVIATLHALTHIAAGRRAEGRRAGPAIALLFVLVIAAVGATGWLGFHSINERYNETRRAIDENQSVFGGRAALYRDTWTLASREPVFGWGLDSYATAFKLVRPRPLQAKRQYEASFVTAHNDWLQSIAETGFVGTTLVLLMGVIPLAHVSRRSLNHTLILYPLLGCALIGLYACVEFPFATAAVLITFWVLFFTTIRHAQLNDLATRTRHE